MPVKNGQLRNHGMQAGQQFNGQRYILKGGVQKPIVKQGDEKQRHRNADQNQCHRSVGGHHRHAGPADQTGKKDAEPPQKADRNQQMEEGEKELPR